MQNLKSTTKIKNLNPASERPGRQSMVRPIERLSGDMPRPPWSRPPFSLAVSSPGHDCSVRLWNMESKTCIQEFTAHRKKSEESIDPRRGVPPHQVLHRQRRRRRARQGLRMTGKLAAGGGASEKERREGGVLLRLPWGSTKLKLTVYLDCPFKRCPM